MGPTRLLSLAATCFALTSCEDLFSVPGAENVQPNAPTRFAMVDYADGVLTLRWDDASNVETGYAVERSESMEGDDFTRFTSLAADSEEFQVGITKPARFRVAVLGGSDPSEYLSACLYYQDLDGDGSGTHLVVSEGPCPLGKASFESGDCDDEDPTRFPGNKDICDGIDNDCDNIVDGGTVYLDADGDGHGTSARSVVACAAPPGYVTTSDDCDDGDRTLNEPVPMYRDSDSDGFGTGTPEPRCPGSAGYSLLATDCNDNTSFVSPGSTEVCDAKDNNCDGITDENNVCVRLSIAKLPSPRRDLSCATVGARAYCLGGSSRAIEPVDEVVEYDPSTDSIKKLSARLPRGRRNHSCAAIDENVYCFGGLEYEGDFVYKETSQIVYYRPASNELGVMTAAPPAPAAYKSCVPSGTKVYCLGGSTRNGRIVAYDPTADSFTAMAAQLPTSPIFHSCAAINHRIYCLGGMTQELPLNQIVEYDPAEDVVRTMGAKLPSGRYLLACVPSGSVIYCFGGLDKAVSSNQIVEYDPSQDRTVVERSTLPSALYGLSCIEIGRTIYCFGGANNDYRESDQIVQYTPPAAAKSLAPLNRHSDLASESSPGCAGEPIGGGR